MPYGWQIAFRTVYILKRDNSIKRQGSVTERKQSTGQDCPGKEEVKSDHSREKHDGKMSCLISQDKLGFNFKLKGETKESPHSTMMLTYITSSF